MEAAPFLMFQGQANDALALYRRAFPDLEVVDLQHHADGELAGQIAMVRISLGGQEWLLNDSPVQHDFTFTPSSSIFIECDSEMQLRGLAAILSDDGDVLMRVNNYGFSTLFTWIQDRFGVSWQLNLP